MQGSQKNGVWEARGGVSARQSLMNMVLAAEGNKNVEGRRPEGKVESNRLKSEPTL